MLNQEISRIHTDELDYSSTCIHKSVFSNLVGWDHSSAYCGLAQRWAAAANRPASSASAEEPTNQGRDNVRIYHPEDGNDFVHK